MSSSDERPHGSDGERPEAGGGRARADAPSCEAVFPANSSVTTHITVNGLARTLEHDVRMSLLDLLRERLALTGTKKGCDHGQCGACTVHVDGQAVLSCLALAASLDGAQVTTIEGVGTPDRLDPMQQAFIDHDALQCGFCTPGQIMSALDCVRRGRATDDSSVREWMSGNLCRCAAYPQIVSAILDAAGRVKG